jgi:hypothetical protein
MDINWNNINDDEFKELNKLIKQNIKQSETNINKLMSYDCVIDKDKFMKVLEKDTIEINKLYNIYIYTIIENDVNVNVDVVYYH